MALKIKKQIKNSDGTITELEGTEAEVEAFLKKQNKKDESTQTKKKNLILGKEMAAVIQDMIDAAITKHALHNHLNLQPKEVHHWHFNNGYWWRPAWVGGVFTYQTSNVDPNVYGTTGITLCNNVSELSSKIGVPQSEIPVNALSVSTTAAASSNMLSSNNNIKFGTVQMGKVDPANYTMDSLPGVTSGFINMNIKS
jgi:hypothetical protein